MNEWNYDEFYKKWLRTSYFFGVSFTFVFFVSLFFAAAIVIPPPHTNRVLELVAGSLNVIVAMLSLNKAIDSFFLEPKRIRRNWDETRKLHNRIKETK